MKYKVVMTDHVYPDLEMEKKLLSEAGVDFAFIDTRNEGVIANAVRDADAVITCYANITAEIIRGMSKCKSISKTGIGVNNINVEQATKQGIRVLNVSDYCVEEVSDTAVALILSLTRRIPFLRDNVQKGAWSRLGSENITRLNGKTLGFLGFGNIARRTAEKMKPFGVKMIAYDPYIQAESAQSMGVAIADLGRVLRESDVLSLNLPLTDETKKIIDKEALSKMKRTALLVNTARGPLIDEEALCSALQEGEIAGAGLDVLSDEGNISGNPLFSAPNAVITPHAAFYSIEATQELREKVLADVLSVLAGKAPRYQVNRF